MVTADNGVVSTNGNEAAGPTAGPSLAALRTQPENVHLFRGFGPLVVGVILFILMVTLAPTVAPERVVERPIDARSTEEAP